MVYHKIFKHILSNHSLVVVWQHLDSGERKVSETCLNSFHMESGLLHFEAPLIPLHNHLPIYCYSEDGQFIFKSEIRDAKESVFSVSIPQEIKILEDPDVTMIRSQIGLDISDVWKSKRLDLDQLEEDRPDYLKVKSMAERSSRDQDFLNHEFDSVSLDEEEKMFADKRESPRARPKKDKWVKVTVGEEPEVHFLQLFDLSRGGIGFVTLELEKFPKGSQVQVVGFDEFDLDDPLVGKIMSHRPIDDTLIEHKIGVKFNEGQE